MIRQGQRLGEGPIERDRERLRTLLNCPVQRTIQHFLAIPGVRGVWSFGNFDENGDVFDLTGQGRTLSYNGNPLFGLSGIYGQCALDGTGDYFSRSDEAGLDIIGNESYIYSARQGLTVGGWFSLDTLTYSGAQQGFIGKWNDNAVNQRAYLLLFNDADDTVRFRISTDGINTVACTGSTVTAGDWYFLVGRFVPSTSIVVFVNDTKTTQAAGVPATVFNSNADFNIGAYNNGQAGTEIDGDVYVAFLSTMMVSDDIIDVVYQQTRAMFGV